MAVGGKQHSDRNGDDLDDNVGGYDDSDVNTDFDTYYLGDDIKHVDGNDDNDDYTSKMMIMMTNICQQS
jgi:hypothetical protein